MNNIILSTFVGSTLHGTSVQDGLEDEDIMSIMLEPPSRVIGFIPKDTIVERTKPDGVRSEAGDVDHSIYGLRKFLSLAMKGNPTILLPLFAPESMIRSITRAGKELRALSGLIISKKCYDPFRGYMRKQHERLMGTRGQKRVTRPELIERYGFDTKYAGHIIRLGFQGVELLATGKLTLPMCEAERKVVVDIRTGKYTLDGVSQLIAAAENDITIAYERSSLREDPDFTSIEAWMILAYLDGWQS